MTLEEKFQECVKALGIIALSEIPTLPVVRAGALGPIVVRTPGFSAEVHQECIELARQTLNRIGIFEDDDPETKSST